MLFVLHVQSHRDFDRAKFAAFLRGLRARRIRAIRVGKVDNQFGHVRSYRIAGRDAAHTAYHLAFRIGLLEWLS